MSNSLFVSYGIPVDVVELGIKVQAMAETQAIMIPFTLCRDHSTGRFGDLPNEMLAAIGRIIRAECWKTAAREWKPDKSCCDGSCEPHMHYKHSELTQIIERELGPRFTSIDRLNHHLLSRESFSNNAQYPCHDERKVRCLGKIGRDFPHPGNNRLYIKYNECLQRTFGLQAYFTMCADDKHVDNITVLESYHLAAYLTLPSQHTNGIEDESHNSAYGSSMVLMMEHEDFQQSPEALRATFARAMRALRLEPLVDVKKVQRSYPSTDILPAAPAEPEGRREAEELVEKLKAGKWPKVLGLSTVNRLQ